MIGEEREANENIDVRRGGGSDGGSCRERKVGKRKLLHEDDGRGEGKIKEGELIKKILFKKLSKVYRYLRRIGLSRRVEAFCISSITWLFSSLILETSLKQNN